VGKRAGKNKDVDKERTSIVKDHMIRKKEKGKGGAGFVRGEFGGAFNLGPTIREKDERQGG